jgi:lactate permease
MPLATYQQTLDPLHHWLLSTVFAGLPVLVLFWLLVPRRWLAPKAAFAGVLVALAVATGIYHMPPLMAGMAFVHGAAFGLFPVGWTIFNAMLIYNITVETGYFAIVRRSIAGLSADARIQAILIGFAFGAFLEGAAGAGTPVAICGAILVGLGFDPFLAAVLCLIANTSPVAYGGLGTPLITLSGVTGLPAETLSIMAGHQLPILSFFVPLYMVKVMCTWKQTWEVWPALLISGGSFALFQFAFATIHAWLPGVVLYPMTDVGGGIFSLVITALFLRYWRPRHEWSFHQSAEKERKGDGSDELALHWRSVLIGWSPYIVMSLFLFATGLVRQAEQRGTLHIGPIATKYAVPIPALDGESRRDPRVLEPEKQSEVEKAQFDFPWLTAPGSAVLFAALVSALLLRMSLGQVKTVLQRTIVQMRIPIPTIACMLGLSYVTRYAGMDATLGVAFAGTGLLYPFFAAILGWLGVFLTGTDAGSNALFGSLQKITATEIYKVLHGNALAHLSQSQVQVLICTANSTGGVMGKMIDAQSICVATAATNQLGREADIFKAVIWHSIILASVVGLMTLLQAYWPILRGLVPSP